MVWNSQICVAMVLDLGSVRILKCFKITTNRILPSLKEAISENFKKRVHTLSVSSETPDRWKQRQDTPSVLTKFLIHRLFYTTQFKVFC
jgi:hypothetical protein